MRAPAGSWVQVHRRVLLAGERAPQVPADTQGVPLELRVKGFLVEPGQLGDLVEIETLAGRRVQGTLVAIAPAYQHDFGQPVPELLQIGPQVRRLLGGAP